MTATIPKQFLVERQGKTVVLYAGLLHLAHERGLKAIEVTLVQVPTEANGDVAICQATVETEQGTFADIGDASPTNVARMVAAHIIRMASTRAKARALRDAVDVGYVALEELDTSDDADASGPPQDPDQPPERPATAAQIAAVNAAGRRTAEQATADYSTLAAAGLKLGVAVPALPAGATLAQVEAQGQHWATVLRQRQAQLKADRAAAEAAKAAKGGASDATTI